MKESLRTMMKGLADPLGEFHQRLLQARENKGLRLSLWTAGQFLVSNQILNVVEHTGAVQSAANLFLQELRDFTGGRNLGANALRSDQDDFAAFVLVEGALHHLMETLRSVRMSQQARHLCLPCDETQVADPF